MTDGAFAGLNLCIRTVTDPGDEVIFLTPPWFFYEAIILGGEANPVRVPVNYETWDLDLDAIEAAITGRTTAIIVNSPNNPSGKIYPPETLRALADVLTAGSERIGHPIYLISDEAYSRILFDDRSFTSPTEFYANSFLVYTYAKQLLTPGQRVGYIALPPEMPDRDRDARGADARPAHLRRPRGADQRPAARDGRPGGHERGHQGAAATPRPVGGGAAFLRLRPPLPRGDVLPAPDEPDPGRRRLRRAAREGQGVRAARGRRRDAGALPHLGHGQRRDDRSGRSRSSNGRPRPRSAGAGRAHRERPGLPPGRAGRGRCASRCGSSSRWPACPAPVG